MDGNTKLAGFRGDEQLPRECAFDEHGAWTELGWPNLAQTYSAVCTLLMLSDDLERLERDGILNAIRLSQQSCPSGGVYSSDPGNSELDVRFAFCAAALAHLLSFEGSGGVLDVDRFTAFVLSARNLPSDGGFGQTRGLESHGGSSYCATAALALCGRLWNEETAGNGEGREEEVMDEKGRRRLAHWLLRRQAAGFHGRPDKPDDTCYAFWMGSQLELLGVLRLADADSVRSFLLSAQDPKVGGFSKHPDSQTDILHTYFSLAALSVFGQEPGLRSLDPALNLTRRAVQWAQKIRPKSN